MASTMATSLLAVRARPGVIDYVQPDGSIVKIKLHGDERFHFATDEKDNLIVAADNGRYDYALEQSDGILVSSGISVSNSVDLLKGKQVKASAYYAKSQMQTKEGEAKYRYSSSAFPTVGKPHSLVVLVEYPDFRFKDEKPLEYFRDFLNGDNFTDEGATGSCRKFYSDNSFGKFVPTFDVYGPVMMQHNRSYYGGGDERNACQMVVEAVHALDDSVDFSQYDHNDDGFVDSIFIIYAHKGEASSGIKDAVWPYSWELLEEGVDLRADGVRFNMYGCSNELQKDDQIDGIGTFTHEFGHVLGLPDLYHTNDSYDYTTPYKWSVMDSGSYLNDSRTPCNFSAFERYSLGWLVPEEIVADGDYTLPPLADSNRAYIMTSESNEDEFFMLEYRPRTGWDGYLPYGGMLVWHIDFVQRMWDYNIVNNRKDHHCVELVRADANSSTDSQSGDPFPGTKKITYFGLDSNPSLSAWNGDALNVTSISDIGIDDTNAYFTARVSEFRGDAGVESIEIREGDNIIYDLSGRKVGIYSPFENLNLPRGIYIVNHQKILIK